MEHNFSVACPVEGLRFISVPTDSFKLSNISVSFALPLTSGVDAAATALLPFLLRRSCKKYPTLTAMNKRLAELYGAMVSASVSKFGESQVVSMRVGSLEDRFTLDGQSIMGDCTRLLFDLIFEPNFADGGFAESDIEREKRLLIENIESELNEKRYYALKRCTEIMCENEVYSLSQYGKIEDIEKVNGADLVAAWKKMLSTAVIQVVAVGSSADKALDEVKNRFSGIDRSSLAEIHTEFVVSANKMRRIKEEMPVKQGKLVMGYRAGMTDADDNLPAIKVMTDIFGGGVYSKLFNNVREKMSLCYYCSARLFATKGIIMVQSGIENENEQKAIDAINDQLEDIRQGRFEDSDLEASHKGLSDTLRSVCDTPEGVERWFASQIFDSELVLPEAYAEKIVKVGREEVIAAAQAVTLDTVYMLAGSQDGEENEDDE